MRSIRKIFFIIFLLVLYLNIFSKDYYICLGSFLDNNNAIEYSISLNEIGINTIHEKTKIKNKYFTRVLLNRKYKNLKDAITELKNLLNNEIIKKENIKDLWIRPGKLVNIQKFDKIKLSSNKKNQETKEKKLDKDKEKEINENIIKEESKSKKDIKENIPLEEIEEEKVSINKEEVKLIEQKIEEKTISEKNEFKIIDNEGYANCIFSSQQIELGKEDNNEIKKVFNKPEKIFARCYLPKNIGKIEGKDFWHEIWINGKFIRKTVFNTPPDPNWDQIQIWISEDDYSDIINSLEKGEYKIIIWILKNEIIKEKDKTEVKTVKLSKGEFTYIVP